MNKLADKIIAQTYGIAPEKTRQLADRLEEFYQGTHIQVAAETLRQQAGELEYYKVRDGSHIKIIKEQADRIAELEKDLYMIQRHYDQLETFSPSGKNAQTVSKTDENLQNGKL